MKIGILGCGATGSVFASYLRMGGADDIWLIDLNKAHMDAVRDHGMTMTDHQWRAPSDRLPHRIQRTGSRPV